MGGTADGTHTPVIIDTDLGGDPDDAVALVVAARRIPELALVTTSDEVHGERARFARHFLDLLGRSDVAAIAGDSPTDSRFYSVEGFVPDTVPAQARDVVAAVRQVCAVTTGPVRWVGLAQMTNLARVLTEAPELAPRLRVTQMGGALRHHDPDSAEHNMHQDVAGARAVLRAVDAGAMATPEFVSADVTFTPRIAITEHSPLYAPLRSLDAPIWAGVLADHLDRWFDRFYPDTMQHDPLALSAALGWTFVGSELLPIELDEIGRTTQAPKGTPVRWSVAADYDAFLTWLTAALAF